MRIAIYWEQTDWGGVDSHLLSLLTKWPSQKDKFVLFYNRGNLGVERIRSNLNKLSQLNMVQIKSFSYNELTSRLEKFPRARWIKYLIFIFQPFLFLMMATRLVCVLRKHGKFDIFMADNGGYPAAWGSLSSILAAKWIGINIRLMLIHHSASLPTLFMVWFHRLVDRMITRTCTAIICPSYATRETLFLRRDIDDEKIRVRVIHNGVLTSVSGSESFAKPDIRSIVDDQTTKIVGIVGRVEAYKGHEDLIFAMARLEKRKRDRLSIAIIGSGSSQEISRLQNISQNFGLENQVHFLGYLPGSSIEIIRQLDLLVLATRSFEGFGLTVAEAMYAGVPVLATRVGAIPEFVDSSVGCLVPPGAPRDISIGLTDFIDNPDSWTERALHAKERIHQVGDSMAEEYRNLFLELLA